MKHLSSYSFIIAVAFLFQGCAVKRAEVAAPEFKINTAAVNIKLQDRKIFSFANEGVFFSNDFLSARLNKLEKENDSTFSISVEPENKPINLSAWYAFKVWGKAGKNVYINLNYPHGKHRYRPKLSANQQEWQTIEQINISKDRTKASFKVRLPSDTLTIAAQEIISSKQSYQWMEKLTADKKLKKQTIGHSIGGKPIVALSSAGSDGKKLVVVLSRQHPPEISGYMAMVTFVETLLGNTALAKKFIENYELVVIPLINPDGVDEGNWRHSFAGVDLNRDWIDFKQPETKAVRDYLQAKVKQQNAKVYFALDFHSTYNDVLYTNIDRPDTNSPGLVTKWVEQLHKFEGDKKTSVKPSGNGGNVSKAWLSRELNAESLTYEVGDNTPRPYLRQKAQKVAEILMKELLNDND